MRAASAPMAAPLNSAACGVPLLILEVRWIEVLKGEMQQAGASPEASRVLWGPPRQWLWPVKP